MVAARRLQAGDQGNDIRRIFLRNLTGVSPGDSREPTDSIGVSAAVFSRREFSKVVHWARQEEMHNGTVANPGQAHRK